MEWKAKDNRNGRRKMKKGTEEEERKTRYEEEK